MEPLCCSLMIASQCRHELITDSDSRVINYLRVSMYKDTRRPTTRIRDRLQSTAFCLVFDVDQRLD